MCARPQSYAVSPSGVALPWLAVFRASAYDASALLAVAPLLAVLAAHAVRAAQRAARGFRERRGRDRPHELPLLE